MQEDASASGMHFIGAIAIVIMSDIIYFIITVKKNYQKWKQYDVSVVERIYLVTFFALWLKGPVA